MSELTFSPLVRAGVPRTAGSGASRSERHYLDFVIDGRSLSELTGAERMDLITPLDWGLVERQVREIRMLLLDIPSDLPGGRQRMFVCPECGDIGCGAITANISRDGERYVWQDFAFENNYDKEMTDRDSFSGVGPFTFEAQAYREALLGVRAGSSQNKSARDP